MRGEFERITFTAPRAAAVAPPDIDGIEFTSVYDGPLGPVFVGYGAGDRSTIVAGDGVGEWRLDWGPGRSVLDEEDRAVALSGFGLFGTDRLSLAWLRHHTRLGHAVNTIGAGARWIVTRKRWVGLGLFRGRDELIGVVDGRKPRVVAGVAPVEVVLLALAHTGLANLISPPSPYKLPEGGFDGP